MANEKAKKGDTVKVSYVGTFDDGVKFDSTEGKDPLEFKLGEAAIIKGFQGAIEGMKVGEEKEVKQAPADAYGERNEKFVQEVPKDKLPKDLDPKENMVLTLKNPEGQVMYAKVSEVKENSVLIDLNHPLAGKTLNFKLKLEAIN